MRRIWQRCFGRCPAAIVCAAPDAPDAQPIHLEPTTPRSGESNDRRLQRLASWFTAGRSAAAELELHEWVRDEDCPPTAMTMLAASLARRGRHDDALRLLHQRSRAMNDDREVSRLLVTLLAGADLTEAARRAALSLHHAHGHDPAIAAWLAHMETPGGSELPAVPNASVEQLTTELVAQPGVIPSLVAAQRLRPQTQTIALLRQAVARCVRDLPDPQQRVVAFTALAELALLAGDLDDARRWAHRGLKIQPFAVQLALILGQVPDDTAVGPPALSVLEAAAAAHPNYPDVRAALIRREHRDGRPESARLRIEHWLQQAPHNTTAQQLAREIAA